MKDCQRELLCASASDKEDGVIIVKLIENKVVYANQAFCEHNNRTEKDVVGDDIRNIIGDNYGVIVRTLMESDDSKKRNVIVECDSLYSVRMFEFEEDKYLNIHLLSKGNIYDAYMRSKVKDNQIKSVLQGMYDFLIVLDDKYQICEMSDKLEYVLSNYIDIEIEEDFFEMCKRDYETKLVAEKIAGIIDSNISGSFNAFVKNVSLGFHVVPICDDKKRVEKIAIFIKNIFECSDNDKMRKVFMQIVKQCNYAISICDMSGNIIFINDAYADMCGYNIEDLIGQNVRKVGDVIHDEDYYAMSEQLKNEMYWTGNVECRRKNGENYWAMMTAIVIKGENNEVIYYAAIKTDITESYEAKKALAESEKRLNLIMDAAEMGLWDWEINTEKMIVNGNWERMLGYNPGDVKEPYKKWKKVVHEDDYEKVNRALEAHIQGETSIYESEYRLKRKDGEYIWVHDKGKVVERDKNGNAIRATGTHFDITLRKSAEQEQERLSLKIQQTQRLESLGVLAGGIAHDFNNLLAGIMGNTELALMQIDNKEEVNRYLDATHRAIEEAAQLTSQLLAYSGQGKYIVQEYNLNDVINEMCELCHYTISKKQHVILELAEEIPDIECDIIQLQQVLMNIVGNATESMEETQEKVLRVQTECVYLEEQEIKVMNGAKDALAGYYVKLKVSDTGTGMRKEMLKRIFDPFYSTKFAGRGLGLSAVLGIVRSHHGVIKVESKLGVGSKFSVYFPASEMSLKNIPKERKMANKEEKDMVLVVDDEPMVLDTTKRMLEVCGYAVLTAENGQKALEVYKEKKSEISKIILDHTMPVLDGAETLRKIREISKDVPVFLASGYSKEETMQRFRNLKLSGYIHKPYRIKELLDMLSKSE